MSERDLQTNETDEQQQPNVNDKKAIDKARAEAAAADKAKKEAIKKAAAEKAAGKGVRVKSFVNMVAKDGTHLQIGKEALLSHKEHARLSAEPRFVEKPHYEVLK
jgi:hypothetical protein